MSYSIGADSEIGGLRTVLVHRPGSELRRISARSRGGLLFDGLPWISRAQQEHDALTQALRDHGAEVLYVTELLQEVLEYQSARDEAIAAVLADATLGGELRNQLRTYLAGQDPESLARLLIAGLTAAELTSGRGVVYQLLGPRDFVIEPLPNLVFSRDSSFWIGNHAIVTSLSPPRRRETEIMAIIYRHHPRFAGATRLYLAGQEEVDGGDVLLLSPGVTAVGVGTRTTPAAVERLARHLLDEGLAHTVLAVPMNQRGHDGHLDLVCTVVASGTVVMSPALAFSLTAHTITDRDGELQVSRPWPFLEAAARSMGICKLELVDPGIDPLPGTAEHWDRGGNALAIGGRAVLCLERNTETNARLAAAGLEVITVPGSELGTRRGGPRCMCTPVSRDPAARADADQSLAEPTGHAGLGVARLPGGEPVRVPAPAEPASDPAGRPAELAPAGAPAVR